MKFFDWRTVSGIGDYLTDERLDEVKDMMYRRILKELYRDKCSINTFIYPVLKDKSDQEIISTMKNMGLQAVTYRGRNISEYRKLLKYSDQKDISFYACNHLCDLVVIFIWKLCTLIWPDKKFLLVWSDEAEHAYVIENGVLDIVYDINWYTFDTAYEDIDMTPTYIYSDMNVYITEFLNKRR